MERVWHKTAKILGGLLASALLLAADAKAQTLEKRSPDQLYTWSKACPKEEAALGNAYARRTALASYLKPEIGAIYRPLPSGRWNKCDRAHIYRIEVYKNL